MKTKPRFSLWTVGLLLVFLASACAPAVSTHPPAAASSLPLDTPTPDIPTLSASSTPDTSTLVTPTVQFVPTSRGPDLEATDPTTVSLASGGLQLVEFFRFT